jgi:hypothetical protein
MGGETTARQRARGNRIIAIAAGAITVTAIVVAFAAEYFDQPWKRLRLCIPAVCNRAARSHLRQE